MGAYLVLYPTARVIPLPAWAILLYWFAIQILMALPELTGAETVSSGVAVMAHVGGFLTGALLVRLFENRSLVDERTRRYGGMSAGGT